MIGGKSCVWIGTRNERNSLFPVSDWLVVLNPALSLVDSVVSSVKLGRKLGNNRARWRGVKSWGKGCSILSFIQCECWIFWKWLIRNQILLLFWRADAEWASIFDIIRVIFIVLPQQRLCLNSKLGFLQNWTFKETKTYPLYSHYICAYFYIFAKIFNMNENLNAIVIKLYSSWKRFLKTKLYSIIDF